MPCSLKAMKQPQADRKRSDQIYIPREDRGVQSVLRIERRFKLPSMVATTDPVLDRLSNKISARSLLGSVVWRWFAETNVCIVRLIPWY